MMKLIVIQFFIAAGLPSIYSGDQNDKEKKYAAVLSKFDGYDPAILLDKIWKVLGMAEDENLITVLKHLKEVKLLEFPFMRERTCKIRPDLQKEYMEIISPRDFFLRSPVCPVLYSVQFVAFAHSKTTGVKPRCAHPGIPIAVYKRFEVVTNSTQYLVDFVFCSSHPNKNIDFDQALILEINGTKTYCDPADIVSEDSRRVFRTSISYGNGCFGDTFILNSQQKKKLCDGLMKKFDLYYSNCHCNFR